MLRKSLVLLAALCSCAPIAYAGDKPLYAPAPAWVVPGPAIDFSKLTDADPMLVVLDQQQRIENGQVWIFIDQAVRVGSPQVMAQVGSLQLPWLPDQGDLIVHKAEIVRGAERIDLLATGQRFQVLQREQQLEQSQLTGLLTATMAVEGLRVGDVLTLRYSTTRKDKALQGNIQTVAPLLPDTARARFARARLSWPSATPFKWKTYSAGLDPKVVRAGGFDSIEIPLPLAKQPELPSDAPARFQRLPILEAATFADWASVSRTMEPLYRTSGLIAPGTPLAAEVAKIAAASSDPRVRAAAALRLVQDEVRYLAKLMDGGNYFPQAPAQTWSLRYGDCKAKTLLLLAMLRELGIQAEPVLASISGGDIVPARLPAPGAFDHVLVRATIGGKLLWLDGTGGGTRLADLGDAPGLRNVLPLRAAGATVETIAVQPSARPLSEISLEIDQSAGLSMPSPFTITFQVRGEGAAMLHTISTQANKEQLSEMVQGAVASVLGDPLIGERSIRYDAESGIATIAASGIMTSPWKRIESRYRMGLDRTVGTLAFEADRARPAWKDIPAVSSATESQVYRVRMRLPDGGKGFTLEGDRTLPPVLAGTRVARTAAIAGGWLTLEDRVYGVPGTEISPAEIPAVRSQIALARTRLIEGVGPEAYPPRWQVVLDARREQRFGAILAAFAKAIADDPADATGYSNRAAFLIGVFEWKGAAADLDKVISIAPDVNAYLRRMRVREALRDDAGALADAQAALALDPASNAAINQVATLRFRKGERDAALAMLAERISAGGKDKQDFVILQSELLGDAGRTDEGVAALDKLIVASPGKPNLLNSRCWLRGTRNTALDAALKDCTKGIELAESPSSIYDSRAMVYYRMGRMEDALADLNAALDVAPDQVASLYLRGIVRKRMGDAAGSETDLVAARLMSPRIDEDYAKYGIKP